MAAGFAQDSSFLISTTGLSWNRPVSRDLCRGHFLCQGLPVFPLFLDSSSKSLDGAEAGPLSAVKIWKETGDKDSEATVAKKSATGGDRAWRTGLHSVQTVEI